MKIECPGCLSEVVRVWADHSKIEYVYPHLHCVCLECGKKFMICPCCGGELKSRFWVSFFGLFLYYLLYPVRLLRKASA